MKQAFWKVRVIGWFALLGPAAGWPEVCQADLLGGDFKFNSVFRFSDSGDPIAGGIPAMSAGLQATSGVEVGPDGNIYVASKDTGEVLYYDGATGEPLPSPLPGERPGLFAVLRDAAHPNSGPGPLRFGPDGNLYVADYGGTTVRVYNGTTGAELPVAATGFGPPAGLAFAPNGDLYVGNFGTSAIIRVRNGQQQTFIASGTGPILTPSSMLVVPNGDLLIVSMFANEIHRYSSSGTYLGVFAEIEPLIPSVGDTNYPSDIAFDDDGNILVAVLGATNPPINQGQILRYQLNEGSVAGTLLDVVVDAYPPIGSIAWIRSADALDGDYNGDGQIDTGDFVKWQGDFGKWVAKGGGADGNRNGIVDAADFVVWRKMLGAADNHLSRPIPEPSTAAMSAILALVAGLLRRPATVG